MSPRLSGNRRGAGTGTRLREALSELREFGRARLLPDPDNHVVFEIVEARALRPGDVVLVLAEDTVAADGAVLWGAGRLDESMLAGGGEPVLRTAAPGCNQVLAGSLLLSGWLALRVNAPVDRSELARMVEGVGP